MATDILTYRGRSVAWVDIHDSATPYLSYLARTFPKEVAKALKSVGWKLRSEIISGLESSAPGGQKLAGLSTIQRVRLLDAIKTVKQRKSPLEYAKGSRFYLKTQARVPGGTSDRPYGRKLPRAVRYKYDASERSVHIGWITSNAAAYGRIGALGARGQKYAWHRGPQAVTRQMRRLFYAAGIPIRKTTTVLSTPARPVVSPVYKEWRSKIPRYVEEHVSAYLRRSLSRAANYQISRAVMGNTAGWRNYMHAVR